MESKHKNDDHRTSEEMIKQFPVVPQEAINEFYSQKGNVNHEYPRPIKKELIYNTPFVEDADNTFIPFIDNVINEQESSTIVDGIEFFPTDPHPYRTGTIIKEDRHLYQKREMDGTIDNCKQYNINANDLSAVMNPLKLQMTEPTEIDYESKRKYFAHLPASVVKLTFKHTTQNMSLQPSSYLHKMLKSPNPSANLKHGSSR
ncbi:hypothetical protein FRACYDRAFT_253777 [Fragilariopsis cylindrus CCMP1102]|uniref:Uncharacterized protein n=1 Tax=Fragilariopsis cylindrus CCMP1102 TaxID=635003 RepID=A0A1E7ELE8_9STRA|nr:hypothetical protein FRACYDRAFT_253777 [Fragilariopsis cylindrus CCMP1102]|eukprot:OEU06704.1 hypothetical protein FRACYDRAFT_253777 [Fragilariopsis cylindrus CCMP1102]